MNIVFVMNSWSTIKWILFHDNKSEISLAVNDLTTWLLDELVVKDMTLLWGVAVAVKLWLIKEFIGILDEPFPPLLLGSKESNADKSMGLLWLGLLLKLENVWLCFICLTLASIKEAVKSLALAVPTALGFDVYVPDILGFNCPDKWPFCCERPLPDTTWLSRRIFCFSANDKGPPDEPFDEAPVDDVERLPCLELSKFVAKEPAKKESLYSFWSTTYSKSWWFIA